MTYAGQTSMMTLLCKKSCKWLIRCANLSHTIHEFPLPGATSSCMVDSGLREGRNRKEENNKMVREKLQSHSLIKPMLVGLLAAGLSVTALAQSVPFPTYQAGPQTNGSYVVSDGTIIT